MQKKTTYMYTCYPISPSPLSPFQVQRQLDVDILVSGHTHKVREIVLIVVVGKGGAALSHTYMYTCCDTCVPAVLCDGEGWKVLHQPRVSHWSLYCHGNVSILKHFVLMLVCTDAFVVKVT